MRISHIYLASERASERASGRTSERTSVRAAFKLEINYYLHPLGQTRTNASSYNDPNLQ